MADLTFSQPARRNLLLPILIALAVLAAAAFAVVHFTPHTTADIAVTRSAVYQSHVIFKSNSIVLNSDQAQDDLYILTTLRITNHLRLPLFLKDFTASLTPAADTGVAPLSTSAVEKPDLATLFTTFQSLRKLAEAQTVQPLYRDTKVDPGQTAEGYIVLHFPGTQALWDSRQDANLSIDLYHQPPLTAAIPKQPDLAPRKIQP